ncbi:hypothetical protein V2J09_000332 [Rumex salicifolius]
MGVAPRRESMRLRCAMCRGRCCEGVFQVQLDLSSISQALLMSKPLVIGREVNRLYVLDTSSTIS